MDRTAFLKLLAKKLYPLLRAEGFKGSGASLRRHDGLFHHIVNVQGSTSGAGCYINLGAHLEFLPAEGGRDFSIQDFDEPSCSFRERLQLPNGERWEYGTSDSAANATVAAITRCWESQGRAFFSQFSTANEASNLEALVQELEQPATHPNRALIGARIALHIGDLSRALQIATLASGRVGEQATGLRARLNEFVRQTSDVQIGRGGAV